MSDWAAPRHDVGVSDMNTEASDCHDPCDCDQCAKDAPYTPLSCATSGHEWTKDTGFFRWCKACGEVQVSRAVRQ